MQNYKNRIMYILFGNAYQEMHLTFEKTFTFQASISITLLTNYYNKKSEIQSS